MSTWELVARITESYELYSQCEQVLYSYHMDTHKISLALLSYPKGILTVYSLPEPHTCIPTAPRGELQTNFSNHLDGRKFWS